MGLHIHSSVKKITNAQYIHVSNDRSWLNRSKHTTYYGKRNTWILRKFSSVQSLSHVWIFVTPWAGALQASLFITNSQSLLKLISIKSVMPSNHLILCHPLLLLPSIFPSIRVFSNESALHIRWPKYWSFSFSISPSNEYSGLISLTIDWFDLLAVQGTLKRLLQYDSSKASILSRSALWSYSYKHYSVQFSCSVVSDSSRPHELQPARLLRPWDFPGKSTGVECHCLLQWQT